MYTDPSTENDGGGIDEEAAFVASFVITNRNEKRWKNMSDMMLPVCGTKSKKLWLTFFATFMFAIFVFPQHDDLGPYPFITIFIIYIIFVSCIWIIDSLLG